MGVAVGVASPPQATSSASSEIVSAEIENRRFIVDHFLLLVFRRGDILVKGDPAAGVHFRFVRGMPHEVSDEFNPTSQAIAGVNLASGYASLLYCCERGCLATEPRTKFR